MSKSKFAWQTIQLAFQVGEISRKVSDLIDVYTDRGYGSTDPLKVEDINETPPGYAPTGVTLSLAQFQEIAGVLVELLAFVNAGAVATKDRGATLNKYRTDV